VSRQADGLRYAVRFSVLAKYFGQLCLVVAVLTILPLVVSLVYLETHISYRYAIVIFALGGLGRVLGRIAVPREVQVNEAMIIVAFMFFFTPLAMTFPMMGSGLTFFDALFEAISGSTTTGLSTVTHLEQMSRTFLFSRAWMQWYGGLGIVVLSLAWSSGPVWQPSGWQSMSLKVMIWLEEQRHMHAAYLSFMPF
jgi:trk system potassium uptake protein